MKEWIDKNIGGNKPPTFIGWWVLIALIVLAIVGGTLSVVFLGKTVWAFLIWVLPESLHSALGYAATFFILTTIFALGLWASHR